MIPPTTACVSIFGRPSSRLCQSAAVWREVGLATDVDAFIAEEGLGPDALDPLFDFTAFERALAGRKRDVKSLLMDQAVIAGIGNIYSDEILFQARIHPRTRSDRLTINAKRDLFSCHQGGVADGG